MELGGALSQLSRASNLETIRLSLVPTCEISITLVKISISASKRRKEHVSFSCAYACAYFASVMLISRV